jgi:hypothetical protein
MEIIAIGMRVPEVALLGALVAISWGGEVMYE